MLWSPWFGIFLVSLPNAEMNQFEYVNLIWIMITLRRTDVD